MLPGFAFHSFAGLDSELFIIFVFGHLDLPSSDFYIYGVNPYFFTKRKIHSRGRVIPHRRLLPSAGSSRLVQVDCRLILSSWKPHFSMSHFAPTSCIFAECLIGYEARLNPPSQDVVPTALPVIEKLRSVLATFMGKAGYRALILRSLVLARQEVPWLGDAEVTTDGGLKNFAGLAASQDTDEAIHGSEALLRHLLDLLVAFIGELLTLRLVHGLWPVISNHDDFTQNNSQLS